MVEPLRPGQLVISQAGRDRGQPFVVIGLEGDRFALVADGRGRSVARPKRKNLRHLRPCGAVAPELSVRLADGAAVSDREIRDALAAAAADVGGQQDVG